MSKKTSSTCIRPLADRVTGAHLNRCTNYFDKSYSYGSKILLDKFQYSALD